MGIGLSVAILLDATLVRLVLLPAMLLVFRRPLEKPGRVPAAVEPVDEREPSLV